MIILRTLIHLLVTHKLRILKADPAFHPFLGRERNTVFGKAKDTM
jgi:hypothetical protein